MKVTQERIQKYLARIGLASRRKAEEMIRQGRIAVNGKPLKTPGTLIEPGRDIITIDGRVVNAQADPVYYAVYKPEGYLSTVRDPHAERTVTELVPGDVRVYPVGRLDRESSGLMILTNDGDLTNRMTHPSFEHEKEYEVLAQWTRELKPREEKRVFEMLRHGVELEDGKTSPSEIKVISREKGSVFFSIILKEGRKRQIRRMCRHVGLKVLTLKRIRMGKLTLGGLPPGGCREIAREDII